VLIFYGINQAYNSVTRQGLIFLLFGSFMALGAIFSWAYLPNVQDRVDQIVPSVIALNGMRGVGTNGVIDRRKWWKPRWLGRRYENRSLERLGEGRERAKQEGEVITIKDKVGEMRRRHRLGSVAHASNNGTRSGSA
jgi:MFS transporter, PHS family, inorganic phosphate transporter